MGYARVSTPDQDLGLQLDALEVARCVRVFHDVASSADEQRPELAACLDFLRPGDVLVVWKLDRLGRSLRHLVETVAELDDREVHVRALSDGIDTSTSGERMVEGIFGVLADSSGSAHVSDRPRHKSKDVEAALREAEAAAGWVVQYPSGHWGRVRCAGPDGDFEGLDYCRITVGGTPRSPTSLARRVRTKLRNCHHGHAHSQ